MKVEAEIIESLISKIPFPTTLVLNTNKTAKHWFLTYNYFIIRNDFTFNNIPFETVFNNIENIPFKEYVENEVLQSIKRYWDIGFEIGKIDIIAWCSEIVEKDSSLFYLYDSEDNYKGIYCHSLNWVEDIVYFGNSLGDFFELDNSSNDINDFSRCESNYVLPRKKLSKAKKLTFEELLLKDEYLILDAEIGLEVNFEFYQNYIDTTIIPLTNNELKYTSLELVSDKDGKIEFVWRIDNLNFTILLENDTDYIDGEEFYKKINEILVQSSSTKLLVPFRHYDFGQEYGLAYLNSKKSKQLGELFNIELFLK